MKTNRIPGEITWMKKYIWLLFIFIFSCKNGGDKNAKEYPTDLPLINLRGLILDEKKDAIPLFSSGDSIEYVQLETSPTDLRFQDVLVTDQHIYVILSMYQGIMMYDRQGKFIKHIEDTEAAHAFELLYNEYEDQVYALGRGNVWILNERDGEILGDVQTLYNIPANTRIYPFSADRFLALYGRNDHYNTKTSAAICNKQGELLIDSVYIGKGDKELAACWWSWSTFVMPYENDDYLFFTLFRGAPYQTIFRTKGEKIEPAYYMDIEAETDIRYAWLFKDYLCFVYEALHGGYILTDTNVTLAVYNLKTGELKSQRLLDKMQLRSNRYFGVKNTIDGGVPILFSNHSSARRQVADLLLGTDVKNYLLKNKISDDAPDFLREMDEESLPVVTIVHYR